MGDGGGKENKGVKGKHSRTGQERKRPHSVLWAGGCRLSCVPACPELRAFERGRAGGGPAGAQQTQRMKTGRSGQRPRG